jgi:dihydropteroate synthase
MIDPISPTWTWRLPGRTLSLGRRPLVMAIVNATPDSFSDGGLYLDTDAGIAHALACVEQGADLLDIGGESTRPGSQPVPVDEELRRVVPVVEALAQRVAVPISVDTSKAAVAKACLEAGAAIVNDITALRGDPDMAEVVAQAGAGVILMHMQGTPATMQRQPTYGDVVAEIGQFLEARLQDPGIGFGKTAAHNLEILARLAELQRWGRPVCLGVSRKGFIGKLLEQRPPRQRLAGSLAAVCHAALHRAAQIVRVHDVQETRDALTVLGAIEEHVGRIKEKEP